MSNPKTIYDVIPPIAPFDPQTTPIHNPYWGHVHGGRVVHARLQDSDERAVCGVGPRQGAAWLGSRTRSWAGLGHGSGHRRWCAMCRAALERLRRATPPALTHDENARPAWCPTCSALVLNVTTSRGQAVVVDAKPRPVLSIPRGRGFLLRDGDGRAVAVGDIHLRVLGRSTLGLMLHSCVETVGYPAEGAGECAECLTGDYQHETTPLCAATHTCWKNCGVECCADEVAK